MNIVLVSSGLVRVPPIRGGAVEAIWEYAEFPPSYRNLYAIMWDGL